RALVDDLTAALASGSQDRLPPLTPQERQGSRQQSELTDRPEESAHSAAVPPRTLVTEPCVSGEHATLGFRPPSTSTTAVESVPPPSPSPRSSFPQVEPSFPQLEPWEGPPPRRRKLWIVAAVVVAGFLAGLLLFRVVLPLFRTRDGGGDGGQS